MCRGWGRVSSECGYHRFQPVETSFICSPVSQHSTLQTGVESKQETTSLPEHTPEGKQGSIGVQGEDHCSLATGHTHSPTLSDLISRRTSSDSDHSSKKDASTGETLDKSQPLQSSVPSLASLMKSSEGMGCGCVPSSGSSGSVGRVPLQKPTSSTPTLSDLIRQSSPSCHPPGTKRDSTSVRGETVGISPSLNDVIQSRQTSQSSAMQLKTPLAKEQNTGDVEVENVESSVLSLSDLMKENRIMRDERFVGNERGKSTISPQDRSQLCSGIKGGDSSGTSPSLSDLMKSNEQLTVGSATEQVSTGKYTSMSKSEDSPSLSDLMSLKKQPLVSADYVQLASAKQSESEAEKSSPSLSDLIRSSKQQSAIVAVMKSSPGKREERESLGNSPSLSSLIASSKQKSSSDQPHILAVKTRDISGTSPSLAELMKKDKPGIAFDEKLASQLKPAPLLVGQMKGRGTAGTLTPKVAAEPSTSSKLDTRAIQPLIPGIDHPSNSSRLPTTSAPSLADLIHANKQTSNQPTGLASVANISSSEPPPKSTPFTHHDLKLLLRKQQIPIEEETPKYHVQDVVVVLPSNTTPTAVIMSRRCCGSHDMRCAIEATAVKTLLADWYCGDLQPFSFTTPSPDDFVLSKQKGHL